jgi:hypothetical protein
MAAWATANPTFQSRGNVVGQARPEEFDMDEVQWLIEAFEGRATSSALFKLDVLMDLERLRDARIVPFLLHVLEDHGEPKEVRVHLLKRLRNGHLTSDNRRPVACAMIRVLSDHSSADLRLQAALALAEFTEVDGVADSLGHLALDANEPIDLRYSAFTSLERAGPTDLCADLFRQLAADDTLGRSARSVLSAWHLDP